MSTEKFQVLVTAGGIKPGEVADLLGVSRTACSRWIHGHNVPAKYLTKKVDNLVDCVRSAVHDGELPLPRGLGREERQARLRTAIVKQIKLKAAASQG